MGRPGVGLDGRPVGMPGRGPAGAPGAGIPGPRANFATKSGRGGTTGRTPGCPARFGLAGGRSGPPPPMVCAEGGAPGTMVAAGGRTRVLGGTGKLGTGAVG